jgi:hypothetical protein
MYAFDDCGRFPPLLPIAWRRLMARGSAVEKPIGVHEIKRAFRDDLSPLALVPFEVDAAS